jgi:hypothetical protein
MHLSQVESSIYCDEQVIMLESSIYCDEQVIMLALK